MGKLKKTIETRRFWDGQGTLLCSVELNHATFYQCKLAQFCTGCMICGKISKNSKNRLSGYRYRSPALFCTRGAARIFPKKMSGCAFNDSHSVPADSLARTCETSEGCLILSLHLPGNTNSLAVTTTSAASGSFFVFSPPKMSKTKTCIFARFAGFR